MALLGKGGSSIELEGASVKCIISERLHTKALIPYGIKKNKKKHTFRTEERAKIICKEQAL